jgi:hypothetical protein
MPEKIHDTSSADFAKQKSIQEAQELWACIFKYVAVEDIQRYKKVWATNVQVFKLLNMDQYGYVQWYILENNFINNSKDQTERTYRRNKLIEWALSAILVKECSKEERDEYRSRIYARRMKQYNPHGQREWEYYRSRKRLSLLRHLCNQHTKDNGYIDRKVVIAEYIKRKKIPWSENQEKLINDWIDTYSLSKRENPRAVWNVNKDMKNIINKWMQEWSEFWKWHGSKRVLDHAKIRTYISWLYPHLNWISELIRKLKIDRIIGEIHRSHPWYEKKKSPRNKHMKNDFIELIKEWGTEWSEYWQENWGIRTLDYDKIKQEIIRRHPTTNRITDHMIRRNKIQYEAKALKKKEK